MNIEDTLSNFIVNELMFADENTRLDHDQDLIESGMLDSVAVLRMIMFVEEQFGVHVEDHEVLPDNFRSVNLVKDFVQRKRNAQGASA
jgi:acyl carrier protein